MSLRLFGHSTEDFLFNALGSESGYTTEVEEQPGIIVLDD